MKLDRSSKLKIIGTRHTMGTAKRQKERRLHNSQKAEVEVLRRTCRVLTECTDEQEAIINGLDALVEYRTEQLKRVKQKLAQHEAIP